MSSKILSFVKDSMLPSECIVCRKPIIGEFLYDGWGNKVCMAHKDQAIHCLSCGRLAVKRKATKIGISEFICEICASNSPQDSDVPGITNYVRSVLTRSGLDGIPDFTLHRVELSQLEQVSGAACEGFAVTIGDQHDIYVLRHLSKTCYASVLAHEMLHLWLRKNGRNPRPEICEGFCNLGSYEVLKSIGTAVALSRITGLENDPDPIYGDGFRKVKKVYDSGGWTAVISKIMLHSNK